MNGACDFQQCGMFSMFTLIKISNFLPILFYCYSNVYFVSDLLYNGYNLSLEIKRNIYLLSLIVAVLLHVDLINVVYLTACAFIRSL